MSWRDSLTIFSTLIKFHTAHEKRSAIFTTLWSLRRDAYTMAWNALNLFRLIDCLWVTAPLFITVWTVVQTVLTATFNTYGDRQISTPPPENQYTGTDRQKIPKNSAQLITSARGPPIPNLVEIHPLGASGQMVWTEIIFIYLFIPFFWSAYRSDPWMDFYAR